jgi:hypothetical protein
MAFNSELQIPKLPGFSVPSSAVRPVIAPPGIPHHVPSLSQDCELTQDCVLALTMASLKSNCSPCEETTRSRRALASRMASASSRRERKKSKQNQWAPSPAHRACTHFRCLPLNGGQQQPGIYVDDCRCTQQLAAALVLQGPLSCSFPGGIQIPVPAE